MLSADEHQVLFFVLSNPHIKLFPALHRKLPTKGPITTASAGVSGNVGVVALDDGWGVVGVRLRGCETVGQLWRCKATTSILLKHLPQAVIHAPFFCCFFFCSLGYIIDYS